LVRVSDRAEDALSNVAELSKKSIQTLDEISQFKEKAIDSMINLDNSMANIKNIAIHLEAQAESISNILKPFNDLSKYLYQKLPPPITETANIISASIKAINTFTGLLSKKK
jgi:DNA helicase IV